jgi:hypothetical protein
MFKHSSLILIALVFFHCAAAGTVPDIKLSLDFDQINVLKNATLRPLIEPIIGNFTYAGPIDVNLSLILSTVQVQLSNLAVQNFSLDWDKTVLAPIDETHVSLTIFDADITIESDYNISYLAFDFNGTANITVTNLTIIMALQSDNLTFGCGFSLTLSNFSLNFDSVTMAVDSPTISWLVDKIFKTFKCLVIQQINNLVIPMVNPMLIDLFSQTLQFAISPSLLENLALQYINKNLDLPKATGDTYIINITMTRAPYVRYAQNLTTLINYTYFTLEIDVSVFNNRTNATPAIQETDLLTYRTNFVSDMQVFLYNSLLIQLQWIMIDSGILKFTIDKTMVPPSLPVTLDTSAMGLLIPGLAARYGPNKSIYLRAQAGSTYSQFVFRAGRLVAEVSLVFDFYVDKDGTYYPGQGIENCTTCDMALSLNATLLLALHADNRDESLIFVNIINLDFYNVGVLTKMIDFDVDSFQTLMKSVGKSFIPIINGGLQGISNPVIGLDGIKDFQFNFSVDFLFLRVVIEENKMMEVMS